MQISVRAQLEDVLAGMGELQRKQAPFAVKWAINAVAADVGQATRNAIQQKFRTSPAGLKFLLAHVQVAGVGQGRQWKRMGVRATEDQFMSAMVGVVPPGGKGQHASWQRYRGSLLAMLEGGGPTPGPKRFGGRESGAASDYGRYAIPVRRPTDRTPVPLRLYPINLGLSARRTVEGPMRGGSLRGKHRTFLMPIANSPGNAMIFQRYGRERDALMPLFWTQRETRLPARRYFFPTAERVVDTRLSMHLGRSMRQALFGRGAYRG